MKIQAVPAKQRRFRGETMVQIVSRGRGDRLPEFKTVLDRARSQGAKVFEDNRVLLKLPGDHHEDIYDAAAYNRARMEWQERCAV